MQTRNQILKGVNQYVEEIVDKASGFVSSSYSDSFPISWREDFTVYVSNPGDFRNPTSNSWEKIIIRNLSGPLRYQLDFGSFLLRVSEDGETGINPTGWAFDSNLWDLVYNQALSSLNDKLRGSLDLAVDIAQAGESRKMMRDTLKLLAYVRRHPVDALKKAFSDYQRKPKQLGSKWLEFQYGWKPLAQSIYDSSLRVMSSPRHLMKAKSHSTEKESLSLIESSSNGFIHKSIGHLSQRCEIAVCMTHGTSGEQLLGEFSSLNPVSIAWEMIPYSFVVDWVYDVGGYIRNMETACLYGSQFLSGWVTFTGEIETTDTVYQSYVDSSNSYIQDRTGSFTRRYKSRSPLLEYPFPRAPRFRMDLGSGRMLNAAALLSQFLR